MTSVILIVPVQTCEQESAARVLRSTLLAHEGGYSVYQGRGAWLDESRAPGRVVSERHERIEVFTTDVARVRAAHYAYGVDAGEQVLARIVDGQPEFVTVSPPVKLSPLAAEIVAQNREE